jgi:hypothetical protein
MLRTSLRARVIAVLTRMRNTQVFSDDRPWKRSIPSITASQVSDTTSSAIARVGTRLAAIRSIDGPHASSSAANAASSPRRSAATTAASSSRSIGVAATRRRYPTRRCQTPSSSCQAGVNRRTQGVTPHT